MLVEKERISIEMDCMDWVEKALNLPGKVQRDSADRLLLATAHYENAVLITCDSKLIEYGKDRFVNVHDPRE